MCGGSITQRVCVREGGISTCPQKRAANSHMMRSIFCASPGSRNGDKKARIAATNARPCSQWEQSPGRCRQWEESPGRAEEELRKGRVFRALGTGKGGDASVSRAETRPCRGRRKAGSARVTVKSKQCE